MNEYFQGKVALVTGFAMGIGLACAEAFARAGAVTVMADIRKPEEQAGKLIAEGDHGCICLRCIRWCGAIPHAWSGLTHKIEATI